MGQLQQKVQQQQQQQQPMQQQQLPMNDEELANTKKELAVKSALCNKLTNENQKLQADFANLKFASAHDREQAKVFKKRTEANESKISAYNASFIELAEKLKQLNDDTKVLRKDKDKQRKKVSKLEKAKKKLKGQIKILNEKIENITAVTKELVKIKHQSKQQSESWMAEKRKYEENIDLLKREQREPSKAKI